MASERVQKILAQVGIASRRKAEELIQEGVVTINGKIAKLGDKAELGKDSIKVRGKLLHRAESPVYLAFYKPKGVISMLADPEGRATLSDFLSKVQTRVFPIGRLDFNSEGLILLTNDGALAEKVQKRDDILRIYEVKIKGFPDEEMLTRIKRGGRLGDKKRLVKPHSVRLTQGLSSNAVVEIGMLGGGAFDIKELFESRGFLVVKITRTAIGHLTLKGLKPGEFKYLKISQAQALVDQPELGQKRLDQEIQTAKPIRARKHQIRSTLTELGDSESPKKVIKVIAPRRPSFSKVSGPNLSRPSFSKTPRPNPSRPSFSKTSKPRIAKSR